MANLPNAPLNNAALHKRTPRACDECRRLKIRCEPSSQSFEDRSSSESSQKCRGCQSSDIDCTYTAPIHKRGPPKGYLSALEQRLNDAEALLGTLLCSKDFRASTLISDLSKDGLASSIIDRVSKSEFGPQGRMDRAQSGGSFSPRKSANNAPTFNLDTQGHLVFTSPSNTWQDYLDMRLSLELKARLSPAAEINSVTNSVEGSSIQNSLTPISSEQAQISFIESQGLRDLHLRLCGSPPPSRSPPSCSSMTMLGPTPTSPFSGTSLPIQILPPSSPTDQFNHFSPPSSHASSPSSSSNTDSSRPRTEDMNPWLPTIEENRAAAPNGLQAYAQKGDPTPQAMYEGYISHNAGTQPVVTGEYYFGTGRPNQQQFPYNTFADFLGLDRKQWDM